MNGSLDEAGPVEPDPVEPDRVEPDRAEPDPVEVASSAWPVALVVQYRADASREAIADFLDVLKLEDLPGDARVTTDLAAGRSAVAFAPWTKKAERANWKRRLGADHLVADVRPPDLG